MRRSWDCLGDLRYKRFCSKSFERSCVMGNAIEEFVEQGKSLSSTEGTRLVQNADCSAIREAIRNPRVARAIAAALRATAPNSLFRRKILMALDY